MTTRPRRAADATCEARRRAGRRMTHSATARLIAQPAALSRSPRTSPCPTTASPKPCGEDLGPRGDGERVGTDHPGAVGRDVAAASRGDPDDEAAGQRGGHDEPQAEEQGAGAGLRVVEEGEPERRPGDHQPGHREHPTRPPVPAGVPAADRGDELEGTDEREDRRPDDVHDQRHGPAGPPVVGRHDLGPSGQLHQPEGSRGDRDEAEGEQARRGRPSPSRRALIGLRARGPRRPARSRGCRRRPAGCATGRRRAR